MAPQLDQDEDEDKLPSSPVGSPPALAAANDDDDDSDSIGTSSAAPMGAPSSLNPQVQDYLNKLRAAQAQAKQNELGTGLGVALQQLTHGLSGAQGQADVSGALALGKNDEAPINNLLTQERLGSTLAAQQTRSLATQQKADALAKANDPSSPQADRIRAIYKPLLAKAGLDPSALDNLSESDIKNYGSNAIGLQVKQNGASAARDAAQAAKDTAAADKQTKADEDSQGKIGKELNGLTASGRNALGTAAKAKVGIQRLQDILKDPSATNEDLNATYSDMAAVISGAATVSGSEHQSYNTAANQLAGAIQYITGNPQAPNIPEVKAHMLDVANRMAKISDGVIAQNTRQTQANHSEWIKRNPDRWAAMVSAATDQPAASGAPSGGPGPASAPGAPAQDPKVSAYAQQYGLDYAHASAILKQRGYGQ